MIQKWISLSFMCIILVACAAAPPTEKPPELSPTLAATNTDAPKPAESPTRLPTNTADQGQVNSLVITHNPNPAEFQPGENGESPYMCYYKTTVHAVGKGVHIKAFRAYFWEDGQWKHSSSNNGKPWSSNDFSEWYSCSDAYIPPNEDCSDPTNWNGSYAKVKWYYQGIDDDGKNVTGEQIIECINAVSSSMSATPASDAEIINLKPDGKGDYPDLAAAVAAASEGAVIMLEKGTYKLDGDLFISKAITLIGAGIDKTVISSQSEEEVIEFNGDGSFIVQNITFKHEGSKPGNVVSVNGGQVNFQTCRFTGGKVNKDGTNGIGLLIKGNTKGSILGCKADTNEYGIYSMDNTSVLIESGDYSNNKLIGIWLTMENTSIVRDNHFMNNGTYGIGVGGDSQPTIENNILMNSKNGIEVQGNAKPLIVGNEIVKHSVIGIDFVGDSTGNVRKNKILQTEHIGIYLGGKSSATLEENILSKNYIAIQYYDDATGTASKNQIEDNISGISVSKQAQPTLIENIILNSQYEGIGYYEKAGGKAIRNECRNNKYGIAIYSKDANPILEDNILEDNNKEDLLDKLKE